MREEVLLRSPWCIYCGGQTPATTVEHMPPRMMFDGKQRPKGLEFGACASCNNGSAHADLVASLIGRTQWVDPPAEHEQEIRRILSAIKNNIPGLLDGMFAAAPRDQAWRSVLPSGASAEALGVGPLAQAYMRAFALKMGLALHFSVTGRILGQHGGISVRWFSNHDHASGVFPRSIFDYLVPVSTLKQGKKEVSDQFQYSWRLSQPESMGLFFASFRRAFAVVAFTADDAAQFAVTGHEDRVMRPDAVGALLKDIRASAL